VGKEVPVLGDDVEDAGRGHRHVLPVAAPSFILIFFPKSSQAEMGAGRSRRRRDKQSLSSATRDQTAEEAASNARDATNSCRRKERTSNHLGRRPTSFPMGNAGPVRRRRPSQSGNNWAPAPEWSPTRQRRTSKPPQSRRTSPAPTLSFASNPSVVCGEAMIAVSRQDKKRRTLCRMRKN